MYGNVVADPRDFSDSALCAFDVDHLFPWSRGGRSVRANFAAVQWDANRRVKSDALIATLDPDLMACGLRPAQFQALMEYATEFAGGKAARRDATANQDLVKHWLLSGPHKGAALSNFQERVRSTVDGAALWSFFEQHFSPTQPATTVAPLPVTPLPELPSRPTAHETPPHKAAGYKAAIAAVPFDLQGVGEAQLMELGLDALRELCRARGLIGDDEKPQTKTCVKHLLGWTATRK